MGRPPPTIAAAPARGTRPRRAEPSQCRHRGPVRTQPPPASSPTAAERVSSMSPGVVAQVMTQGLIIIPQLKQLSKNQLFPMNFVTKGACRRKAGETEGGEEFCSCQAGSSSSLLVRPLLRPLGQVIVHRSRASAGRCRKSEFARRQQTSSVLSVKPGVDVAWSCCVLRKCEISFLFIIRFPVTNL